MYNSVMFVIAGNRLQAREFIDKKMHEPGNQYKYIEVTCVENLIGFRDPEGYFVGTWEDRHDIHQILQRLQMSMTVPNPQLKKVSDILLKKAEKHTFVLPGGGLAHTITGVTNAKIILDTEIEKFINGEDL
jgi:hypothetical protein